MGNFAYIDNQNLYMATSRAKEDPWDIDMRRFRIYLKQKYNCNAAYLFMGAYQQDYSDLYQMLQRYGYVLVFREHSTNLKGQKKGNVDTDLVFQILRDIIEGKDFEQIVLVSGDGDYKRLVDYLIQKGRFRKILLPNKRYASSLYKNLTARYVAHLDTDDMRKKLEKNESGI